MGDAAVEDEDAGNWEPRAVAIAAMTASRPATRILRIRVRGPLFVLDCCGSRPQSRQRGVASTFLVFDMPTTYASS